MSNESKLTVEEDSYVSSFKVELMDAVVQWCKGASFSDVCKVRPHSFRLFISLILLTVNGRVRRIPHPSFPPTRRTSPSNDPGGEGDWE